MFRDRIGSLGVVENIEQAIKKSDTKCRYNVPTEESFRRRTAFTQLRNANGRGQHRAIENVDVKGRERRPQTKLRDVAQVKNIVIKSIPKSGGGKCGHSHADFFVAFEVVQKDRIKKEVHHQFFEIKIVTVPEFGNRARR